MSDIHCHTSSGVLPVSPLAIFELLADGARYRLWTWGALPRMRVGDNLFQGVSAFGGAPFCLWLDPQPEILSVAYHVGRHRDDLAFRQCARVFPGPVLDHAMEVAVLTLATWRTAGQSDEDWARSCADQDAEIFLIKGVLTR